MHSGHIVIVGASLAALRTLQALRRHGFEGRITVVGAESHLPYDRPPLSKAFLTDESEPSTELSKPDELADLNASFELGATAVSLDPDRHVVALEGGDEIGYESLVIATGSSPRRLPAAEGIDGIHVLRTVDDGRALRADLESARRMVVVGAGFIGCEIAASARARGLDVTVVEALDQPLVRGLGSELGAVAAEWYRSRGVQLHLDTGVIGFASDAVGPERVGDTTSAVHDQSTRPSDPGRVGQIPSTLGAAPTRRVTGVELSTDETIPADVVVVGIGVIANTDWLSGSGVTVDNGVVCDEFLAVQGVDDVWAVGDVARWPHPAIGSLRLEHWTSAAETADRVATNLLARAAGDDPEAHSPVPYVWSDQFDTKIQIAGHISPADTVDVVWGSTEFDADTGPRFVALAHRGDRVTGVVGFSRPRQVMMTQMAMERGPLSVAEAREIIG